MMDASKTMFTLDTQETKNIDAFKINFTQLKHFLMHRLTI